MHKNLVTGERSMRLGTGNRQREGAGTSHSQERLIEPRIGVVMTILKARG